MPSAGQIKLSKIKKMLKVCAPELEFVEKEHRLWVVGSEKTYRGLPKGAHGKGDKEIEKGHIKQLLRFFGVDDECVKANLPAIGNYTLE